MKIIRLKRIELTNFCGFASAQREFECPISEIIGQTGSGKSTFAQAVRFVFNLPTADVKPMTANKTLIPKLDTSVKITLEVDNLEYVLERQGKQNWKVDKTTGIETYNGYEMSSFIFDGIACNSTQFTTKLTELFGISKEHLPLVAITEQFNRNIDWKARRKFLFELCGVEQLTVELKKRAEFVLLANDLLKGKTTDEISKVLNSEKLALSKDRTRIETTINVRTADLTQYAKIDFAKTEKELKKNSTQLEKLLTASKAETANEVVAAKLAEIAELQAKILKFRQAEQKAKQDHDTALYNADKACRDNWAKWKNIPNDLKDLTTQIESIKSKIASTESQVFSEDTTCRYCKQELPKTDIDTKIENFENGKKSTLEALTKQLTAYEKQLDTLQCSYEALKADYTPLKAELDRITAETVLSYTSEITALQSDIEAINAEISNLKRSEVKSETAEKIAELKAQQRELTITLGKKQDMERINGEIERLNGEMQDLNDKEGLNIKKRKCLNDYIMASIALVTETINSKFSGGIKFRLFDRQLASSDNEFVETCSCEYNNVDFDSLSCGQQNQADLLVCLGLQNILGINLFVFKDNAQDNTLTLTTDRQLIELVTQRNKKVEGTRIEVAYSKIIETLNATTKTEQADSLPE